MYYFFRTKPNNYAYVTMASQTVVLGSGHSITLIIKSAFYSLYSCKIRSWSLRVSQFGVCQENTP